MKKNNKTKKHYIRKYSLLWWLTKTPFIAIAILILWLGLSYTEVLFQNLTETPSYSNYNLFIVLEKVGNLL